MSDDLGSCRGVGSFMHSNNFYRADFLLNLHLKTIIDCCWQSAIGKIGCVCAGSVYAQKYAYHIKRMRRRTCNIVTPSANNTDPIAIVVPGPDDVMIGAPECSSPSPVKANNSAYV